MRREVEDAAEVSDSREIKRMEMPLTACGGGSGAGWEVNII